MKVLVTGGAGYIGSTTALALEQAGHTPVILDSLITGPRAFVRDRIFYEGDIADRALLDRILSEHPDIQCTLHFAALCDVPASTSDPYGYYYGNVAKTLEMLTALEARGQHRVVYSSSAAVYATPRDGFEVTEDAATAPASPYARTKLMIEEILADCAAATPMRALVLRYFNPIGADPTLSTGSHLREPSHVLGQLVLTAQGQQDAFTLTGIDHPTRDGTALRDYIHVWDVAQAHVAAVERFDAVLSGRDATTLVVNIGAGTGVTVRELVDAFERIHGSSIRVVEAPPRPGDIVGAYASTHRAEEILGWRAQHSLDEAIGSALAWSRRRRSVLGYD